MTRTQRPVKFETDRVHSESAELNVPEAVADSTSRLVTSHLELARADIVDKIKIKFLSLAAHELTYDVLNLLDTFHVV